MSLIHEALKRAEADKSANGSSRGDAPLLPTSGPGGPHRRRNVTLATLLVLLAGAGAFATYWTWGRAGTPQRADASMQPPTTTIPKVARPSRPAPAPVAPKATPDIAAVPALAPATRPIDYAAAEPAADVEAPPPSIGSGQAEPAMAPSTTQPTTAPAEEAVAAAPEPQPKPQPPARPAPLPGPDPESFRVTAIMFGPEGPTAIINGRFVQVGEQLSGAKVVGIRRTSVDLEANGQRVSVGLQ